MSGKRRIARHKNGRASPPAARRPTAEDRTHMALAQLGHELRTPLTGLLGILEMLDRTKLDAGQRSCLQSARRAGETLLGLINDLLDSSGLALGRIKIRSLPFDPNALLHETVQMLLPLAREKGLALSVEAAPLPAPIFHGDPYRLRQVLTNLVHNAIKFTERGSVRVELRPESRAGHQGLWFSVRDTGVGIEVKRLGELRSGAVPCAPDDRPLPNGTGLGLFISRQLVELMGGTLFIESQLGQGSTISFWVPPSTAPRENGRAEPVGEIRPDHRAPRVLVVEDNPENCLVAVAILDRLGCGTDVARNGQEAVQKVFQQRYDLVLMDWQMSAMDGPSATRAIRNREVQVGGRVPIVAMTAHVLDEQRKECLRAGMDDFLPKPFTLDDLEDVLHRWVTPGRIEPGSS